MNYISLLDMFYYYGYDEQNIITILDLPNDDNEDYLVAFDDGSSSRFEITYSKKYGLLLDDYFKIKRIFL